MKKIWVIIAFSVAALSFVTLAAEESSNSLQTQPPKKEWKLFDPQEVKHNRLWIDVEALLWQSNETGLDYGTSSKSTTSLNDGHGKNPHFNWDWGFRLGLGYKLPHDKWDLYAGYTYIHATAQDHFHDSSEVLFPSWQYAPAVVGGYATHASTELHTHLNIGDLELGRNCLVSKWLSIRPFFGVRGVVIDQHDTITYQGGTAVPAGNTYKNNLQNDFWGVGIRMGMDTLWGLGYGISIYGNGAASLLSGKFNIEQMEKLTSPSTPYLNVKDSPSTLVAEAELALGIQWDYLFSKDRYHFGVKFGWEFNVFFDQNRLMRFNGNTNPGSFTRNDDDLAFQGLTLGMRFDF